MTIMTGGEDDDGNVSNSQDPIAEGALSGRKESSSCTGGGGVINRVGR